MNSLPRKTIKSRVSMSVATLISLAVLWWFGRSMVSDWDSLSADLGQAPPPAIFAVVALAFLFCVLIGLCYYNSLRVTGATVRPIPAVNVYLASQLGKYVPGRVLYVAGHLGLASWLRVSVAQAAMSFTVHHLVLVTAGALFASPLLGMAMPGLTAPFVALAVAGTVMVLSGVWVHPINALQRRRRKSEFVIASRVRVVAALGSSMAGWVGYGLAMVVLSVALTPDTGPEHYLTIGMAAVAAWLIGFLSFITPAGLGVREATFVLLTRQVLPEPNAIAVAAIWRLLFTIVQVPLGAVALTLLGRNRPVSVADAPGVASAEHVQ